MDDAAKARELAAQAERANQDDLRLKIIELTRREEELRRKADEKTRLANDAKQREIRARERQIEAAQARISLQNDLFASMDRYALLHAEHLRVMDERLRRMSVNEDAIVKRE
ncbi:hypothetical protein P43SY_003955 [Pythium insidiosum]|uniref:Uncharacterized protein n=1 Tax=Pythium insidiosum TaxID=114742 RepID=A0AAD5L7C5_PYTIN|nr:hypothetical protein P43SY_003955 [Pythium insidiosum]